MKYAHYNEATGKLIGWYDTEIHGVVTEEKLDENGNIVVASSVDTSSIPTPNVEVSEEDWKVAVGKNYNFVDAATGIISYKDFRTNEQKTDALYKLLQQVCDRKSIHAKNFIAGKEVTDEQLQRYEEKYEVAKEYMASGDYEESLKLEADMQGLTVEELAKLIVGMGDSYREKLVSFNAKIEAFRVKVSKIIASGNVEKASKIIEQAKSLGADTTDDQIMELFNE